MSEDGMDFELDRIVIGERHRKDLGDIDGLCKSIAEQGLLQPIVVRSDGTLIAGARRVEAFRLLGYQRIPARVRDDLDEAVALLRAERDENTCRKDFTPSEAVALGLKLEELARSEKSATYAEAARRREARRRGEPVEKTGSVSKGATRDRVAAALNMGATQYEMAKKVVLAAESGDHVAQEALVEMDRTGKVEPAYRRATGKEPRYEPVAFDPAKSQRNAQVAAKNRERLGIIVGTISSYTDTLDDFRLAEALAGSSEDEISMWESMLGASIKRLQQLRADIRNRTKRGAAA